VQTFISSAVEKLVAVGIEPSSGSPSGKSKHSEKQGPSGSDSVPTGVVDALVAIIIGAARDGQLDKRTSIRQVAASLRVVEISCVVAVGALRPIFCLVSILPPAIPDHPTICLEYSFLLLCQAILEARDLIQGYAFDSLFFVT